MKTPRAGSAVVIAAALVASTGCTATSIVGPEEPADVTLDVHVTGGVAGVDFRLHIDGSDRLVELTCMRGCATPAEPVLALSVVHWQDLVDEVVASGLPAMGKRDYGSTCCDFFQLAITYSDGEHEARVTGDSETLPPALTALAGRLHALQWGTLAAVIRPGATPGTGPDDPLAVDSVWVDGLLLSVALHYSGGCRAHAIDLVAGLAWMESSPVQTPVWLTHDADDDPCDALPHETRTFDLRPLAAAYRATYPGAPAGERLILKLSAPGDTAVRSVEVVLP